MPSKRPAGAVPVEFLLFSYPIGLPGADSAGRAGASDGADHPADAGDPDGADHPGSGR